MRRTSFMAATALAGFVGLAGASAQAQEVSYSERCLSELSQERIRSARQVDSERPAENDQRGSRGRGNGRGNGHSAHDRIPPGQLVAIERMAQPALENSRARERWFGTLSEQDRRRYYDELQGASREMRNYDPSTAGGLINLAELILVGDTTLQRDGCGEFERAEAFQMQYIDLQTTLHNQQQSYQTMSAAQKVAHDTAMAIIQNIRA